MTGLIAEIKYKRFNLNLNISLMADNNIIAILGRSGTGKTTILRCICGLEKPESAYIRCNNAIWHDSEDNIFIKTYKRSLGYVSQSPNLFPHLTVKENLLFGYNRISSKNTAIFFDDIVQILNLEKILSRNCYFLSGGEQQKVNLGRALLTSPDLLLLDEPVCSLDIDSANEIIDYLKIICTKMSMPIVFVTHNISEAQKMSNKVFVLEQGFLKTFDLIKSKVTNHNIANKMYV
ncbi:MAG: ATP-binding cassette domain-containing protein [Rickettsiaceae bacterium]|nr:ATP-binding cassette domain-containing protein [Rickettsiaceae bacterium]